MKWKEIKLQTQLYLISAFILLAGLVSAASIYLTADDGPDSSPDFENSKMYIHDLELYGGKANVFANDLRHWFAGLWQGKSLAFTIACITVFISFVLFFVAKHLYLKSDAGD